MNVTHMQCETVSAPGCAARGCRGQVGRGSGSVMRDCLAAQLHISVRPACSKAAALHLRPVNLLAPDPAHIHSTASSSGSGRSSQYVTMSLAQPTCSMR